MNYTDVKDVWIVLQNTDLTEGRGSCEPIAVAESETTAMRLGKGKDVQGCDCRIEKVEAFQLRDSRYWYAPVSIQSPNHADRMIDELRERKRAAEIRAEQLGLTKEEVADLARQLGA